MQWSSEEMATRKAAARQQIQKAGLTKKLEAISAFMDMRKDGGEDMSVLLELKKTSTQLVGVHLRMTSEGMFSFTFVNWRKMTLGQVASELMEGAGADCWKISTFKNEPEQQTMLHDEHTCEDGPECARKPFYSSPDRFQELLQQGLTVKLEFGSTPFATYHGTATDLKSWSWGAYDLNEEFSQAEWGVLYHFGLVI